MRSLIPLIRLLFSRQALRLALRAAFIVMMSFAMAFGFLAGSRGPWSNYDPYLFAVGTAARWCARSSMARGPYAGMTKRGHCPTLPIAPAGPLALLDAGPMPSRCLSLTARR